MNLIKIVPALADQVYQAIFDDICSGRLTPGTHLKQEQLAKQLGVSRQPVQQAMALLKADGLVEDVGRRGLRVSHLDINTMHHHYEVRGLLDGLAVRNTAKRIAGDQAIRKELDKQARNIIDAGRKAINEGDIPEMIRLDEAFHRLFYETSGNPLLAQTAEPHWRYLRRVMGDVLRDAEPPHDIWNQHAAIVEAVLAGDAAHAEQLMTGHATLAAELLATNSTLAGNDRP